MLVVTFSFSAFCFCSETDLWKALDAAAEERECKDLKLWRQDIMNNLYWTAASPPNGDPDGMEAK